MNFSARLDLGLNPVELLAKLCALRVTLYHLKKKENVFILEPL